MTTTQLMKEGLPPKCDRLLVLKERSASVSIDSTFEQMVALERMNSCMKERHVESSRPGELLWLP